MRKLIPFGLLLAGLAACALNPPATGPDRAERRISADDMLRHIQQLASDEFEGRAPGSRGEQLTVDYIRREFERLGLEPAAADGSYVQAVPMVGINSTPSLTFKVGGQELKPLRSMEDYVAWSARPVEKTRVEASELVFVGHGVQAPEYGWDDFKGMDLRGKTLVMLINDPAIPDPANPSRLDPRMFKGSEMTYYGRWTYKFETAARLGAAAAIIVHETGPAGYPFDVVRHSWGHKNLGLADSKALLHPPVSAWMQQQSVSELMKAAGFELAALKQAALSRDFRPVALGIQARIDVSNRVEKLDSRNVVARITGSDPALRNEAVVYTAHWDHLGIDTALPGPRGRQIYHGALDNAAGVASLFNIARAFKALPERPRRTVLFIATTAEEQGLLGAQHYVGQPLLPLDKTLLAVNIDVLNAYGRTRDLRIIGAGRSDVDELVVREAQRQGRTALPDAYPELGSFYRSDQFEFAKAGVPVLFLKAGTQVIGKPEAYGGERRHDYVSHRYHKVDDVVEEHWDLSGAVEDLQVLFRVGLSVANGDRRPQWRPDAEFQRPGR
ncbi:M28 family peptidase [Pelomonas sp. SE-A7]|uniref:M28 family peptidase n=1 Tax=Pelomonas sp. SE-A7 TaxID=3054953 RepID=UPI00259CBD6D|nr:M28 family peptidase [Pelomonas sp. SE-A7]MDM4766643.1 M20/M25/M40 family metallo-hydrolase [Pelomonas sp. SE-A7]